MTAMTQPTSPLFWDRIARKYARQPVKNMDAYRHTMARTRLYLGPEDTVLEIGAGTGSTAILLAPHVRQIIASDISSEMVAIGNEKIAAGTVPNARSIVAVPGDEALAANGPYNAVLAFNLLHLVEDVAADAAAVHKLLKPGGVFISKTPCLRNDARFLKPLIWAMQKLGKAPFVRFLSRADLKRDIAGAGFEIVEAEDHNHRPTSHFIVARKT